MNRRIAILPFFACSVVLVVGAVACSSSSTPDITNTGDAAPANDGSNGQEASMGSDGASDQDGATVDASDSATTDSGDSGLVCGAVTNTAPVINDAVGATTVPVGTGGAIADGVYFMTADTNYLTSTITPTSHTYTANIVGTSFGLEGHDASDATGVGGFTIVSTIGGTISLVGNCPAANVGKTLGGFDSYTATTTTLTLYSSSKKNGAVFTKQ
jgi:hypothetical protein